MACSTPVSYTHLDVYKRQDPHRAVVYKQYKDGTVPFQFVYNYNFTTVNAENVWAKAVNRVVQDKIPAEQAVDEMIASIKQIAG